MTMTFSRVTNVIEEGTISQIDDILSKARLIICAGPGGVGKTTTSAALALRAAMAGKKAIVLTIDPARRLADSLGLDELTNDPQRITLENEPEEGGELWAMMLDQQQTLDDLVKRYAPDPGAVKRSRENNIYKLLSSALHGMQEYMALDKLHDLYTGRYYDLVVLDTPPTKNALEFLDTPGRARQFFDDRIIKWFLPNREGGFFRRLVQPASVVISLMQKIFGESFVNDLVEFFDTLQFLQEALRNRGDMIDLILREETTHFFVITGADTRRIDEALFFHQKLSNLDQRASAFVLNRVIPEFTIDVDDVTLSDSQKELKNMGIAPESWAALQSHYQHLQRVSRHNHALISDFEKKVGSEYVHTVELMGEDIHSLEQLRALGSLLAA